MIVRAFVIVLASIGPLAFPAAQVGYGSLHDLALLAVLPSVASLAAMWAYAHFIGRSDITRMILRGASSGAVATLALEAVRYSGFRLGFMPGNLPQLMGVLILDRFALGPSGWSDLAGFAYHFWNGAAFGIVFVALTTRDSIALTTAYGIAIGFGFLLSPVVQSLGVGLFGREFGWQLAATVLTAHATFGAAMGLHLKRFARTNGAPQLRSGRWRSITAGI
jgi:hypothetical protein